MYLLCDVGGYVFCLCVFMGVWLEASVSGLGYCVRFGLLVTLYFSEISFGLCFVCFVVSMGSWS